MPWLPEYGQGLAGWGQPPQLHAGDISGVLGDILRNRIAQQQLQQEQVNKVADLMAQREKEQLLATLQRERTAAEYPTPVPITIDGQTVNVRPHDYLMYQLYNQGLRRPTALPPQTAADTDQGGIIWRDGVPGYNKVGRYGSQWTPLSGAYAPPAKDETTTGKLWSAYGLTPEDLGSPQNQGGKMKGADAQGRGGVFVQAPEEEQTHIKVKDQIIPKDQFYAMKRQADREQQETKSADKNLAPGYGVPAQGIAPSRDAAADGQQYYAPDGSVRIKNG